MPESEAPVDITIPDAPDLQSSTPHKPDESEKISTVSGGGGSPDTKRKKGRGSKPKKTTEGNADQPTSPPDVETPSGGGGGGGGVTKKLKPTRKTPSKRSKKSNAEDTLIDPITPLPPKPTHQKSRPAGRQNAGRYTHAEVRAMQLWIHNRISGDWEAIARAAGEASGIDRKADNMRSLYTTVIFWNMLENFPPEKNEEVRILEREKEEVRKMGEGCCLCGAVRFEEANEEKEVVPGPVTLPVKDIVSMSGKEVVKIDSQVASEAALAGDTMAVMA